MSFPILYDRDSKVSKLYDVAGMPTSVIIDRSGKLRLLHRSYKPGDENEYLDSIRSPDPRVSGQLRDPARAA